MKLKGLIIVLSVILCVGMAAPVWAQSQDSKSQGGGDQMMGDMHHGMMGKMHGQQMGKGHMGGCPMAMDGGGCPMAMGDGCPGCPGGRGWMGSFHQWMKNFMIHADLFKISDEQKQELESKFTDQYKNAVRTKSDIKLMKVDLMQALRKEPIELEQVRDTMNQIASKKIDMKMNFLELYTQMMQMLDEKQQEKVKETIGTPFPMPWEQMSMDENMGGGSMSGDGDSSGN